MAAKKKPQIGLGPISDDLARMLVKALSGAAGAGKKSQARRVVSKITKKNPVATSAGARSIDAVKKNVKSGKENTRLSNAFVQNVKDEKVISSYGKQIGREEVMGKRATGRYVSTTGRVKHVGPDAAKAAGKESTGINKGINKRTRTDGQKNIDLKKDVANAKTADERRKARQVLREFQDRTGFR